MIGQIVGRYRIVAKLGEDEMGSAWKAEDPLLNRALALKLLADPLTDSPEARQRFLREARAASLLNHPGIATVFDVGEAGNRIYIAMRYVEGQTVADRLRQGSLGIRQSMRIAGEAGQALAYAHSQGIVHRDVCPRNILVASDGQVVVLGFGLAPPEGRTSAPRTGARQGMTPYLAPEVLQGIRADACSDVYALGVVLYEMLAGELPEAVGRDGLPGVSGYAVLPPPSRLRAGIPPALDELVLRALQVRPENRYQSAAEFVAALSAVPQQVLASPWPQPTAGGEAALHGGATSDRGAPKVRTSVLDTFRRVRQRWLLGLGLVLMVSVSMAIVVLHRATKPDGGKGQEPVPLPIPRVAVLPLANQSPDPEATNFVIEGIGSSLATHLTRVLGSAVVPWMTSRRYEQTPDLSRLQEIAHELRAQALIVGTFRMSGDRVQVSVALLDGESGERRWRDQIEGPFTGIFDLQAAIAVRSASQLKRRLTSSELEVLQQPMSRDPEAYRAYLEGEEMMAANSREAVFEAGRRFAKAVELDPDFAEARVGLGASLTSRYYRNAAQLSDLEQARASFLEALRLDPALATARRGLIHVHFLRGEDEECLKQGQEVVKLGLDDVENLLVRADAYHFGTLFDKAIVLYQRVLELDPANANAQAFLTISYSAAGRHQEAIQAGEVLQEKFAISENNALRCAGESCACLGDTAHARDFYEKADAQGDLVDLEKNNAAARRARLVEVRDRYRQRLALFPDNPWKQSELTSLYADLGEEDSVRTGEVRLLKMYPGDPMVCMNLGYAHESMGQLDRAIELFRQALRLGHRYQMYYLTWECAEGEKLRQAPGYEQFRKEYDELGARLSAMY